MRESEMVHHLVNTENPDKYTVCITQLIPVLTKAIQELSTKVELLESKLAELPGK